MTEPTVLEVVGTLDHGSIHLLEDSATVVKHDDEYLLVEQATGDRDA
jgi:hypothetical protein